MADQKSVLSIPAVHSGNSSSSGSYGGLGDSVFACPDDVRSVRGNPDFTPYHGASSVFHCGYEVHLGKGIPGNGAPQAECVYNPIGELVRDACGGSANDYDSADAPLRHTFLDRGGIVSKAGFRGFVESIVRGISDFLIPPAY